ncbi:MAG: hypothetical protein Q8K78_12360 [Planctomycetaceae bacterium]|nr:hypothetical protein [Planctomycetaceae bacterium]
MNKALLTSVLWFGVVLPAMAQSAVWDDVPLAKLNEVTLPANALKGNWKVSKGIRIDNLADSNLAPEQRAIAEAISKNGPQGLRSVADYTLVTTGFPLNTVTVRVFAFEKPSECEVWWRKKYEGDDGPRHYEKLDYKDIAAVRSLQEPKIAVAFGRVCLTSHQLQKGDDHILAARYIIEQLTQKKRTLMK